TAIELMPVAAFAGKRGWGYDGVLPFAPAACYGSPASMKQLIDEAHARGLMVLLDVVYNHFGPEGNYLHAYAPQFFSLHHETPWGAAINFDGDRSTTVRDFFIHNALYWLGEFHLDGLRLDAVHAIIDRSHPDFVTELAARVARAFDDRRRVHLVLENDLNQSRYLRRDAEGRPLVTTSQWNDDFHHALHVLAVGETDGYYADYAERPLYALGRALAEGFVFQGESSAYRGGERRGEPSSDLPPTAFVAFAQNHDQVGNRAFGERLATVAPADRLKALVACMLLSPQVPLLFMGEEFGATTPFLFFCDFGPELAAAVTEGRREEFARFERFHDPAIRERIPDPNARATFEASKLAWNDATAPVAAGWIAFYRECLSARRRFVVPLMTALTRGGSFDVDDGLLRVDWAAADGRGLVLVVNLGAARPDVRIEADALVYASAGVPHPGNTGTFPANGVLVSMRAAAT
ncbi:MAG: malto-oligosyltrehalose trehalohydrolase, partial [Betaproteobacteria bacterium]